MIKQKQMTEKVELSDEELDGVAGGMVTLNTNVVRMTTSGGGYRNESKVPSGRASADGVIPAQGPGHDD